MEYFYEQHQTKNYGSKQWTINMAANAILIMAAIYSLSFKLVGVATFLGIYGLILLYSRNVFLEYEYELTEDEIVISKIMNKKRRKVIATIKVSNITEVKKTQDVVKGDKQIIKACLKGTSLTEQIVFAKTSLGIIGFHLAMDEDLIKICKRINPLAFNNI